MTLEEAIELAKKGVKMTHEYFTSEEWMIMQGGQVVFEDGVKASLRDWTEDKDYLLTGWEKFKD